MTLTAPSMHDRFVSHCFGNTWEVACSVGLTLLRLSFSPIPPFLSFWNSLTFCLCPHFLCCSGFAPQSVLPPKIALSRFWPQKCAATQNCARIRTCVLLGTQAAGSWAFVGSPGPEIGDTASDTPGSPDPAAEANDNFFELLLGLYYSSSMGAETLCSKTSRHLQHALGFGEHRLQPCAKMLPGHCQRRAGGRPDARANGGGA